MSSTPESKDKAAKSEPYAFSRLAEELIGDFRKLPFDEPAAMRRRATKPVASVIEELIAKYKIGTTAIEDSIRAEWPALVGQANAQYSIPMNVDDRSILMVGYSHSMVHTNLSMMKPTILAKVKALPNCGHIKDIRFKHA